MEPSDDSDIGESALPDESQPTIDLGCGVLVDEPTIDHWAEGTRVRHMRTVGEIGANWSELPEDMRKAWRDLTRAAAAEACAALALARRDRERGQLAEALRTQIDQYMARYLAACQTADPNDPAM
jgi:hypothetical protein